MSRILVIGGCGYVGSRLVPHLASVGHSVDSVDLEWRGNPAAIPNMKVDYRALMEKDLEPYEAVIVLAGHTTVKACIEKPRAAFENNVSGFIRLCGKLRPDQKLIYASSAVVAANVDTPTTYDLTKQWCEEWATKHFPNSWGLRFGTVCGPSPNIFLETMMNGMVYAAVTKNMIEMRNPNVRRPLLGINDLCRGVEKILAGSVKPGIHNLVSVNTTVADLAAEVSFATGAPIVTREPSETYDFEMTQASWFFPQEELDSMVEDLASLLKNREAA